MAKSPQQMELSRQRREAVVTLSAKGLETSAIATRLGISMRLVREIKREIEAAQRPDRATRIREECRAEAEQARERRIEIFQTTSPASGSRKTW